MGADQKHFDNLKEKILKELFPKLKEISAFDCVPPFVSINADPVASIEDLNVMAPDSIYQNTPIKYLSTKKPTQVRKMAWAKNQKDLMTRMDQEYDNLAKYIVTNFI